MPTLHHHFSSYTTRFFWWIRPRSVSLPSWLCSDRGTGEGERGWGKGVRTGEKGFELQRVQKHSLIHQAQNISPTLHIMIIWLQKNLVIDDRKINKDAQYLNRTVLKQTTHVESKQMINLLLKTKLYGKNLKSSGVNWSVPVSLLVSTETG